MKDDKNQTLPNKANDDIDTASGGDMLKLEFENYCREIKP